ncbi:MAG: 4Fe-4S binding protein [Sandaracinaceae bacterium]|nr:4Fe-4S binding protein [Sandaracinaceae bacterium]
MKHFLDAFRALRTTIGVAARKPITVEYPEVERPRLERYRTTSFALLHNEHGEEACIGCLQCERICPSQVITIKQGPKRESAVTGKKRGWIEDFTLDTTACIFCELCVQVCPEDAIAMASVSAGPTRTREDLVLTMQKLYDNEKGVKLAWGIGSKLMAMQEDPTKEKKVAKPAAAADGAPKAAAPAKAAPAKAEEAKAEAPKADAPKAEGPKVDAPKAEAPKAEAPKAEAPKAEAPKAEAPKAEAPKAEGPKVEAPKVEAPKAEEPKAEAPKLEPSESSPGEVKP